MPGGRPTKYRPEFCQQLVEHMAKGLSFESFQCGAGLSTMYEWVERHPEFAEAKSLGWQKSLALYESLGYNGLQGKLPKFNATAWIFIMKCRFRAAGYRDHVETETTVKFQHDPGKELSEPELLKAIKALKE